MNNSRSIWPRDFLFNNVNVFPVFCLTCPLQLFLVKHCNNFFPLEIIYNIMFSIEVNICIELNINRIHFCCSIRCVVVSVDYIMLLIYVHIFWYCSNMLVDVVLQGSHKSFFNSRFPFIMCWLNFIVLQPI